MDRTVYFADKALTFAAQTPGGEWYVLTPESIGGISRAKILKILETHNFVAILCASPDEAFARFAAEFVRVEAAGGVVVNERGEWLMIRRNGRWDLPKGHVERGEANDECAVREICEETGVEAAIVRPLCRTLHAYYFAKTARWELKYTHWFALCATTGDVLAPQTEEGIERVAWCSPAQVAANLRGAFPTIRRVAQAMNEPSDSAR